MSASRTSFITTEANTRGSVAEFAAFSRASSGFKRFNDVLTPQQSNSRQYAAVPHDVTPELTKLQSNYQRRVFNTINESATDPQQLQKQQWLGEAESISRRGVSHECTSLTECPQAEELVGARIARSQEDDSVPPSLRTYAVSGTYSTGRESVPESNYINSINRIVRGAGPNRFIGMSDIGTPIVVVPRPQGDYTRVLD